MSKLLICFVLLVLTACNWKTHAISPEEEPAHSQIFERRSTKNVLVIDADQSSVMAVALMLAHIEHASRIQTHKMFDIIVGRCFGGVLALYLSQGKSAIQFLRDMAEVNAEISPTQWWKRLFVTQEHAIRPHAMALKKLLGHQCANVLETCCAVMAFDDRYQEPLLLQLETLPHLPLWHVGYAATTSKEAIIPIQIDGVTRNLYSQAPSSHTNTLLSSYLLIRDKFPNHSYAAMHIASAGNQSHHSINSMTMRYIKLNLVMLMPIYLSIQESHTHKRLSERLCCKYRVMELKSDLRL